MGREPWIAKVRALITGGKQVSDPVVWQELADCILANWGSLIQTARPLDVLAMLQRCGDQQLKMKLLEVRLAQGDSAKEALAEFRREWADVENL